MNALEWKVAVGADVTTASYAPATAGKDIATFICAHGAGGSMADRGMQATAAAMCARGFGMVRFNFLYRERKSSRPDAMPKLMDTTTAVVARAREELGDPRPLLIGGRSMGGRAASMLAAEGFAADGLLLLAYPLHPAGQPTKLRVAHLADIRMPVIAFSGTRDPLCTRSLMEDALTTVAAPWDMQWIDSADHSFHVLKSSGTTDAAVLDYIADTSRSWVQGLGGRSSS
ncbi:MAG: alpha/beta family hydrolase [bacterium]